MRLLSKHGQQSGIIQTVGESNELLFTRYAAAVIALVAAVVVVAVVIVAIIVVAVVAVAVVAPVAIVAVAPLPVRVEGNHIRTRTN